MGLRRFSFTKKYGSISAMPFAATQDMKLRCVFSPLSMRYGDLTPFLVTINPEYFARKTNFIEVEDLI